jgi:hypothetical protein
MRIGNWELKKIKRNTVRSLHPDYKSTIEHAFTIGSRQYYRFKDMMDMPRMRYEKCMQFIREAEMRITHQDLNDLIDLTLDALNKGKVTDAIIFQNSIQHLTNQFIETDTYFRLFSCLFFDLDEDITDYDFNYNEAKIIDFRNFPEGSFFFTKPMRDYLPAQNISERDLEVYLRATKSHKEYIQKIKSDYITKS